MTQDKYTYQVHWSDEDQEFVGRCLEFPSLSWLGKDREDAFRGIVRVVGRVLKNMARKGETPPERQPIV